MSGGQTLALTPAQAGLQTRLGYNFKNPALLVTALTHASAVTSANRGDDYERLEFLGDRVVGLIVAERLYAMYPAEPEGDLSKRHTALVRAETLARAARTAGIADALVLSESEKQSGGAGNENILSDVMEAVIGAIYLDAGAEKGLQAARDALNPLLDGDLRAMSSVPRDAKTSLQEWAQARNLGLPEYTLVSRTGPDHAPDFTVTVRVRGFAPASGNGTTKRAAEKSAAQTLLDIVEKTS